MRERRNRPWNTPRRGTAEDEKLRNEGSGTATDDKDYQPPPHRATITRATTTATSTESTAEPFHLFHFCLGTTRLSTQLSKSSLRQPDNCNAALNVEPATTRQLHRLNSQSRACALASQLGCEWGATATANGAAHALPAQASRSLGSQAHCGMQPCASRSTRCGRTSRNRCTPEVACAWPRRTRHNAPAGSSSPK